MSKVNTDRLKVQREIKRLKKQPQGSAKTPAEGARENREKRKVLIYGVSTLPSAESQTPVIPNIDTITATINGVSANSRSITSNETIPYTNFNANRVAHREFNRKFLTNSFGHSCDICDCLWFKNDMTKLPPHFKKLLCKEIPDPDIDNILVCKSCTQFLSRNHVPTCAKFNGFKYPERPAHLPPLDSISERLISPRIPFKKIQRLRHTNGQYENLTQIINIPVPENTMVHHLPRNINDNYCIYVDIEHKKIYKSNNFINSVNKRDIITWLQYLITTPLYKTNDITIEQSLLNNTKLNNATTVKVTGNVLMKNSLIEKQHTLLWNVDEYIKNDTSEVDESHSRLFDGNAEELCFPSIYLGRSRVFKESSRVTPSMMVSSELRRSDRRGVTPDHLLYMAMKIMRLRVHDTLNTTSKNIKNDSTTTRQQILSGEYFNHYLQNSLVFLRCIPNSTWYWKERKRDLFAMMRQLGKPTLSLTVSANEIAWTPLLQLLYKLKNNVRDISEELISQLNFVEKTTLVNEDAVTCVIYFNKMVDVLIRLLQSQTGNPFGKYRVLHHFQRIEFQYPRSPCIHILLWLENAPKDVLGADREDAIALIDEVISVSMKESSGNIQLQTHQHTSTCYKKVVGNGTQVCQFGAPFMPCRSTIILIPMIRTDPKFTIHAEYYKKVRTNLENHEYLDIDAFYEDNGIMSDQHYMDILRAGITRPRVFVKREPSEKWHEAFNPYILNILQAHMNIQLILNDDSCVNYVIDYINKTDRGITDLQRKIITIMDKHSEFNLSEITRKLSVDVLNTVEITSQEAAWYLLREPMSKSSSVIAPIQTLWPFARQLMRKNYYEFTEMELEDESADTWKEDWFVMYQTRPIGLETVTLAQFVAHYTRNFNNTTYVTRKSPRIIRYRNYDMATHVNDFKREMVLLHVPFRDEEMEILADMKFLELYDNHEKSISLHRKEFESDMDIQKIIDMCNRQCREEDIVNDDAEVRDFIIKQAEPDPFQAIYHNKNLETNCQFDNLMPNTISYASVHIKIENPEDLPFQIFSSSPAKCRKTFITRLLMEIYNCHAKADGSCNIYIHVASTGNARVENDGPPTYTAWKILPSKMFSLSVESMQQYRELFQHIQVLIIDEIRQIDAEELSQIDTILKRITGNSQLLFGGIDIILTGDLHQLPQDQVYKLKFLELKQMIRKSNRIFALLLTKISRNMHLEDAELQLLESRFFSQEEANQLSPHGIRLFSSNDSVDEYNQTILKSCANKVVSVAKDIYIGCDTPDGEREFIQTLRNMPVIHTAGLPYNITFVVNKSYMLTTVVDGLGGLAPGSLGKLVYIEFDEVGEVMRVWLEFYNLLKFHVKTKRKVSTYMRAKNISEAAVPVERQSSSIALKDGQTIIATRDHFPLVPACGVTINKYQGEKFNEIVYEYSETHSQQLLYMALSQVTNITRLYIVTPNNDPTFYHGRKMSSPTRSFPDESPRSPFDESIIMDKEIVDFITSRKGLSMLSFSCQNRSADFNYEVRQRTGILLLSEICSANDELLVVPKFNCMARFKRHSVTNRPAVYHNSNTRTNIVTAHMDIHLHQSTCLIANTTSIGEVCAARCTLDNKQNILTVIMYVLANQDISQLIPFIHEVLLEYTVEGAVLLGTYIHKIPIILSGNFNIDFDSPEAQPLIEFLHVKFDLKLTNDSTISSGKSRPMIDAVFTRYLDQLQSTSYVSYFIYDKQSVISPNCEEMDTL